MRRRPPRSTRTDTLVPDPRLFRALLAFDIAAERGEVEPFMRLDQVDIDPARAGRKRDTEIEIGARIAACGVEQARSEEHTSELQSLIRLSYAVFCLKKKKLATIKPRTCAHHRRTTPSNTPQR